MLTQAPLHFEKLPEDIIVSHIIPATGIGGFYTLRLVSKSMQEFTSKTLAGGFIKKLCKRKNAYEKTKYEYDQYHFKNTCTMLGIALYGVSIQFINGALCAYYANYTAQNILYCGGINVIVPLVAASLFSGFAALLNDASWKDFIGMSFGLNFIFTFIVPPLTLGSENPKFFEQEEFTPLGIQLPPVTKIKYIEAIPLVAAMGYCMFSFFQNKKETVPEKPRYPHKKDLQDKFKNAINKQRM